MSASPVAEDGTIDWSHPLIRDSGGRVSMRIFDCKKPVLGAINGAAVGIGATMTLSMDARLASDTARYGFVFARRGIVPEAAPSWFLPRPRSEARRVGTEGVRTGRSRWSPSQ